MTTAEEYLASCATRYYDKNGKPLTMERWSTLFEDGEYKIIRQEDVGDCFVSTVWLGLDHSFGSGQPILIFETMIFTDDDWSCTEMWRYSTVQEAIAGHEKAIKDLKEDKLFKDQE